MTWILFSRDDCHLCDAFEEELNGFIQSSEILYEKVDVDSQQELQTLYGNDVPVLSLNGQVICQHFFDKDKILKVIT